MSICSVNSSGDFNVSIVFYSSTLAELCVLCFHALQFNCVRNQQKFGNASGSVRLNSRGQCCFTKDVQIGAVRERGKEEMLGEGWR